MYFILISSTIIFSPPFSSYPFSHHQKNHHQQPTQPTFHLPATKTSTKPPTPFFHSLSPPTTSPLLISCAICLSQFTTPTCALRASSSRSSPANSFSNCALAINHALRPYASRLLRACVRRLR